MQVKPSGDVSRPNSKQPPFLQSYQAVIERLDLIAVLAALVSTVQFLTMYRLRKGDFLNSYPFISDDGFDWVTQGLALKQFITGVDTSAWPVLRHPIFVFVTFIDSVLNSSGAFILLIQSLAVGGVVYSVGWLARRLSYSATSIFAISTCIWLHNFSYFRLWILADTLAVAFMTGSACLMIASRLPSGNVRHLNYSAGLALLAGLTQTYGLIPFVVMATVLILLDWARKRSLFVTPELTWLMVIFLVWTTAQSIWIGLIPHIDRPANFALIHASLGMINFYLNVWAVAFGVFVPLAVLSVKRRFDASIPATDIETATAAAVAAFAFVTLLYQWPDARFTYIYIPLAVALLLLLATPGAEGADDLADLRVSMTCFAAAAFGALAIPGEGYWQPTVRHTQIDWQRSWPGIALAAAPLDRFSLEKECNDGTSWCAKASVSQSANSPYVYRMMSNYRRRKGLE